MKQVFSKENLLKVFRSFAWVAVLVFVVDIVSKWCVQNSLTETDKVVIIPNFINVILAHNLGAAFSLGANGEIGWRIAFMMISIIMSGVLIFVYTKYFKKFSTIQKVSLMLMTGGAIGNMIDRCFYWSAIVGFDGVIDWIDFNGKFATFNIADSALVIGVAILIIVEVISMIQESIAKGKRGEYDMPPNELEKKENGDNKGK